jgi:hypothetical protein
MNMPFNYQSEALHKRFQASETWQLSGRSEDLDAVRQKHSELLGKCDDHPPHDKFRKIMDNISGFANNTILNH